MLIIDDGFHILKQYQKEVSPTGQPGVGDAFLKWVLTNRQNPERCQQVHITPTEDGSFEEFPKTPELRSFDRDEHKFVAVALTHRDRPYVAQSAIAPRDRAATSPQGQQTTAAPTVYFCEQCQ